MELIALSGYARSGKDTAADVLTKEYGFRRVAFADKLRDMLYALNPIVAFGWQTKHEYYPSEPVYVQNVIDRFGWDGYKETEYGLEIRRLSQRLGTEAGRQTLWDSIWIDAALTGFDDDDKIVVTDARFENEAKAIVERGGRVWRVTRRDVGPANNHLSETGLDNWKFDYQFFNYGYVEEYREQIRSAYESGF